MKPLLSKIKAPAVAGVVREKTVPAAIAEINNCLYHGADMIVTACPLCRYNLEKNGSAVPVIYFTELLAEALGVKEDAK